MPGKLARTCRTSVLFVPEKVPEQLKRILVPIDFSDYSREALEQAVMLACQVPGTEVLAHHIYEVPVGYYKSGYTREQFQQRLQELSEEHYQSFITKISPLACPVRPLFSCDDEEDKSALICKTAIAKDVDLMVIGAKGHTALSVFLLGSLTEKLLRHYLNVPVLVVKKPHEELGFLDTVLLE
jgi:nucleotide-binding universal stress UspA family protein